ncbi:hypothetical protein LLG07_05800 [bacterium]|nr:hypothetical protein [bacterium]
MSNNFKEKIKTGELTKKSADTYLHENCCFNRYDKREEKTAIGLYDSTIAGEKDNY